MKKQIVFSLLVSMFGVLASTANLAPPFPFDKAQDGKFPGWYGQTAAVRVVNDVPPGVPGGKSICLDFSDKPRTGGSWGISSRRFKIDPAKSYRLSVWTKTEGKKKGFGYTFGYFFYNEKQLLLRRVFSCKCSDWCPLPLHVHHCGSPCILSS